MNENPFKVDDSTLLDILEDSPSNDPTQQLTTDPNDDIVIFLHQFNVEKGRHLVDNSILYRLYYHWSKSPKSTHTFKASISKYFLNNGHGKLLLNLDTLKIDKYTYNYLNKSNPLIRAKTSTQKKHLLSFLSKYDLKPGTVWLPFNVLYYLYGVWIYSLNKKTGLGSTTLKALLKLFLPHKIKSDIIYFRVSTLIYKHISLEHIEEINQGKKKAPQVQNKPKSKK